MSLKYSTTTADYLVWSDAMNLIRKLAKDENYKISLLIALGCFTGLRISDILSLRWKQILGTDEFTVIEQKTGKVRTIRLNPQLQHHIKECYEHINPVGINAPILISQKGTIFTVQRINIILKEVKKKYRLPSAAVREQRKRRAKRSTVSRGTRWSFWAQRMRVGVSQRETGWARTYWR